MYINNNLSKVGSSDIVPHGPSILMVLALNVVELGV